MDRFMNWLNSIVSSCLGRRSSGHAPLKEKFIDKFDAKQMILLKRTKLIRKPVYQTAPILQLSNEILLNIFNNLSLHDLAMASGSCKQFQELANFQFTTKHIPLIISDENVFGYDEVIDDERLSRALDIIKAFGRLIDTFVVQDFIYFRMLPMLQAQMMKT